jgi:hypothetical protein
MTPPDSGSYLITLGFGSGEDFLMRYGKIVTRADRASDTTVN